MIIDAIYSLKFDDEQRFYIKDNLFSILKFINDYYGHVEGDLVLVKISNALEDFILRYNQKLFICRYGGDEFLMKNY